MKISEWSFLLTTSLLLASLPLNVRAQAETPHPAEDPVERELREEWGFECGTPYVEAAQASAQAKSRRTSRKAQLPRVFPEWEPADAPLSSSAGWESELRTLLAQGRRDKTASPEFLDALERVLNRHAGESAPSEPPSSKLPFKPTFKGPGMPPGWNAIKSEVWEFGDGQARQVFSQANTCYILSYEPGKDWKDYELRLRFESEKWFTPPMSSAARVYVRYKGMDGGYCVNWNGGGALDISNCQADGKGPILVSRELSPEIIKDGLEWRVRVHGDEITVWHAGKRMLLLRDDTHKSGTIGLESSHIPMTFSDVEVQ